jgi:hypothetical protein
MWTNYPPVSQDRLDLMYEGVLDLEFWLFDLLRKGPNTLSLDNLFTRLTDFKLNGVASFLRQSFQSNEQSPRPLSILYFFISQFKYLYQNKIYPDLETLQFAGVLLKKVDILKNEHEIFDDWTILAIEEGEEINLCYRITWLGGINTGKIAKILDFRRPNDFYLYTYSIEFNYRGCLVFYPSKFPVRALAKDLISIHKDFNKIKPTEDLNSPFIDNPYLLDFPVCLRNSGILQRENKWFLRDSNDRIFRITEEIKNPFAFGLWNGYELKIIP